MGPGRRTLRDTSRVLRFCSCLPGRSSVVKQMPLCYNTEATLTNNRRSAVQVRSPAPKRSRPFGLLFFYGSRPKQAAPKRLKKLHQTLKSSVV